MTEYEKLTQARGLIVSRQLAVPLAALNNSFFLRQARLSDLYQMRERRVACWYAFVVWRQWSLFVWERDICGLDGCGIVFSFKSAHDEVTSCHVLKMVDENQVDQSSSDGTDCADGLGSCPAVAGSAACSG